MSKDDSTGDTQSSTEVLATDPDPVQIGKAADEEESATVVKAAVESKAGAESRQKTENKAESNRAPVVRGSRFGLFNFVLILGLATAAGYYWWLQQQQALEYQQNLAELRQQLSLKASNDNLSAGLAPLRSEVGGIGAKLGKLENEQQGLREASEKLYRLFGRDKNAWQLAEVEYLMRVAQHKLILQNDFQGAAITLQAASNKIGLTGDPGLLPVRVMISEEIAELKTRKRADLVGMTLILAQLSRQIQVLRPGFAVRVDESQPVPASPLPADASWVDRIDAYIEETVNSLVQVKIVSSQPSEMEADVVDIGETLADNLKLARWSVLERDARQYQQLIDQSLRLFREFYDLDNAGNHEFMAQLQSLQKMPLKPEKPDITGSLRELQRILAVRETTPEENTLPAETPTTEPGQ